MKFTFRPVSEPDSHLDTAVVVVKLTMSATILHCVHFFIAAKAYLAYRKFLTTDQHIS